MFKTIPHANDGSELAFKALRLALIMTKQNAATFHLVCVEEIPLCPNLSRKSAKLEALPRAAVVLPDLVDK
jgi:hypothetical protein